MIPDPAPPAPGNGVPLGDEPLEERTDRRRAGADARLRVGARDHAALLKETAHLAVGNLVAAR
jgi:hypothetical protein